MSVYLDSCCFIDVAKYDLGHRAIIDNFADKEDHIKACIQILKAAENGDIRIITSTITIAECQHLNGIIDDNIRGLFRNIRGLFRRVLTSGRIVRIKADDIFIAERARDLMWDHGIRLSGADALHVATALEAKCGELITSDNRILKWAAQIEPLGLKAIRGNDSQELLARLPEPETTTGTTPLLDFLDTDQPDS